MFLDGFSCVFKLVCSLLTEGMHAAMDIGVVLLVIVGNHIDHLGGCLGGSCIVEIDQWLPIDFARKYGKIGTNVC